MRTMCAMLILAVAALANEGKTTRWDFEDATVGQLPKGWKAAKTGEGEGSVWKVIEDKKAPKGPKALAQTADSPGSMFNICVAEDTNFKDVEVSVAFKAIKGQKDQGGGIVWRYTDANNYYVARMNPLEDNYRLYHVVAGKRTQFGGKEELKVPTGEWHTLTIKHVGDTIVCFVDGKKQIEAKDTTITKLGKVGVWTKADAQTAFDDFSVSEVGK